MPHNFFKEFRTNLPDYAVVAIGKAQAFVIQYVETKVREVLEELLNQCPPQETLKRLTTTVNNTRTVMTQVEQKVNSINKIADLLDPVLIGARIYVDIQSHRIDTLVAPVTLTPGTPIPQKVMGQIISINSRVENFQKLIQTVQDAQFGIRATVTAAKGVFVPILATLNIIDSIIARCASEEGISQEQRNELLNQLQAKTDEIYRIGVQYRSSSGRTYTIKVVNDPSAPSIAPKRQAIAQDFRGITVLTGPSSFASNPNVLVEELKFRIENQLP